MPDRFIDETVIEGPDGVLGCTSCIQTNCGHIMDVIDDGLDGRYPFLLEVSVPVFVTCPLTVECTIEPAGPTGDRLAMLSWRQSRTSDVPVFGFVRDGEGRKTLRALIIDWLEGLPDDQCNNKFHMVDRPETRVSRLVDRFSVFSTGQCRACQQSDLVPKI